MAQHSKTRVAMLEAARNGDLYIWTDSLGQDVVNGPIGAGVRTINRAIEAGLLQLRARPMGATRSYVYITAAGRAALEEKR